MNSIHIKGGVSLCGKVRIQGSKNAALPILAATILTKETNILYRCPKISDVYQMLHLLRSIGCVIKWEEKGVLIDAGNLVLNKMPTDAIVGMRSSLYMLGAMLGRFGYIVMEQPGGCVIGERPIDLHLSALTRMGAVFWEENNMIYGKVEKELTGACIELPFPSVGATGNIILAAVTAQGDTCIKGAAREPEIVALCEYLQCCGAIIEGAGTDSIRIEGNRRLFGTEFIIPTDRIVAGTYLFGALATNGCVFLEEAPWEQMTSVISVAESMGAECQCVKEGLYVQSGNAGTYPKEIRTAVYPGFPTDMQSILLPVLTKYKGPFLVEETIFENRFRVVEELRKMGADIQLLHANGVLVNQSVLTGCEVEAMELRGGAALIVAGLMAEGTTVVKNCGYIARGYENICKDLRELGARICSA